MADVRTDFYVYVLFRPTGIPCYVGKGRGNRWLEHEQRGPRHHNKHLARIIAKAGGQLPKVKIRENLTDAEACAIEIEFIKAIGREANGGPLVNLTDGGEGTRRTQSAEERARRIATFNTLEVREKMRLSHLGKPSGNRGRTASEETRERLRNSHLGIRQTQETKDKRAAKNRGLKRSQEIRLAMGIRSKAQWAARREVGA